MSKSKVYINKEKEKQSNKKRRRDIAKKSRRKFTLLNIKDKVIKCFYWGKQSSWKIKLIAIMLIVLCVLLIKHFVGAANKESVTYETQIASTGNLISTISATGTITSGNYTNVTTKTSGVVSKVYVVNGDTVAKGQKIAEVNLDDYAKERQSTAWVAYLEAQENYLEVLNGKSLADIAMWNARQEVLDAQEALDDMTSDNTNPLTREVYTDNERMIITKTLDQKRLAFSVAESRYKNSDADIVSANAKIVTALKDYQENSATIIAPSDGVITDLALAEGIIVSASTSTSTTNGATIVEGQTAAKISNPKGQLIATVNLTEIDIVNVKANQKVNLTLDAYEDKSFTGKVLAVITSGSVSSGVTSYPVSVLIDPVSLEIYPNMAVNAEIITGISTGKIVVPLTAVQTTNGQGIVQVLEESGVKDVVVETGLENDTHIEILTGLAEGVKVIVATTSINETSDTNTTSPFSGIGRSGSSNTGRSGGVSMPAGSPPGF
ncbi:efflux RND transporter periplasmic adaptor subunit [Candidatus Woesebacteria bacterium]|nr:MAG: efflux RND transporter periplasmic adaptor subunit [Candidatus Woesebacteria bacterium]